MKKLMYVVTNGYDALVSYDFREKVARYVLDNELKEPLPRENDDYTRAAAIKGFLITVTDDSTWSVKENINNRDELDEFLGVDFENPESTRVIEEITMKEHLCKWKEIAYTRRFLGNYIPFTEETLKECLGDMLKLAKETVESDEDIICKNSIQTNYLIEKDGVDYCIQYEDDGKYDASVTLYRLLDKEV